MLEIVTRKQISAIFIMKPIEEFPSSAAEENLKLQFIKASLELDFINCNF
jgi:hypothetical protein